MGYEEALEAAGAKVLKFEEFGSYQGDWWALVLYEGKKGWINGDYGSCSGCDSFEAEFGWEDEDDEEKLSNFGKPYLEGIFDQKRAGEEASRNIEWDSEAKDMLAFLKENSIEGE